MVPPTPKNGPVRRRDLILNAAIELFRSRGVHGVGIDDIGAGPTSPARGSTATSPTSMRSSSLSSIEYSTSCRRERNGSCRSFHDDLEALGSLMEFHTTFVLDDRDIINVYHREQRNHPQPDRRRRRAYLQQWVTLLRNLHPAVGDAEALGLGPRGSWRRRPCTRTRCPANSCTGCWSSGRSSCCGGPRLAPPLAQVSPPTRWLRRSPATVTAGADGVVVVPMARDVLSRRWLVT